MSKEEHAQAAVPAQEDAVAERQETSGLTSIRRSSTARLASILAIGLAGGIPPANAQSEHGEIITSEIETECRNGEGYIIHTIETSESGDFGLFIVDDSQSHGYDWALESGTIGAAPEDSHSRELSWEDRLEGGGLPEDTESVELYHGAAFGRGFGGGGRDLERTEEQEQYVDFTEPIEFEHPCNGDNGQGGAVNPIGESDSHRWDGSTRTETAIETSRNTYDEAENAVLTTSQDFPDALAGTPLAAASEGPLLLTGSEELHEGVASELERLGVDHVYVLGGDAAVSEHVESQLGGHGYQVTRLDGDNRFETAAEIARALPEQPGVVDGNPETATATSDPETDTATSDPETDTAQTPEEAENEVLLADGGDFADALAGGSLGAQEGSPILLTPSESLHSATEEYLQNEQVNRVTTLGGSAAVSESVEREAAAAAETEDVDRLAGSTRIDTAIEIADEKLGRSGDRVVNAYFASAYDWPDALAGGHATSQEGDVLLLVNGHDAEANHALDPFIAEQRPDVDRDQWETITILGGTAAISEDVELDLIFRVNAHPTSDDSSTTSNDSSVSAITTDVAADDPDETRRSEEVARRDEINSNSRAVVTYDANGKPQVELKNAA